MTVVSNKLELGYYYCSVTKYGLKICVWMTRGGLVMINFMCQNDFEVYRLNIVSKCACKDVPDAINILTGSLIK